MHYKSYLVGLLLSVLLWMCIACESKKSTPDSAPAIKTVQPQSKNDTPQPPLEKSCPDESMARARESLAANLQAIYKKEGRLLTVNATGDKCDVLELSGPLAEGTYTLDAAERETVNCAYCMALYKKTKFKAIRFLGPSMNTEYEIK